MTPDTLLICSGFSFLDFHIRAVLDEALAGNAHTAIYAFQYRDIGDESAAARVARARPNMSVYARDGAIINGVEGLWRPGPAPNEDWQDIRLTFWRDSSGDGHGTFLLGDFAMLARFLALTQAQQLSFPTPEQDDQDNHPGPQPVSPGASDA